MGELLFCTLKMAELKNNSCTWESKKQDGNEHYKNGRFDDALVEWNLALDILSMVECEKNAPSVSQSDRDQQARDLASAALSGNSSNVARLLSSSSSSTDNYSSVSAINKTKAQILANMAQAKIQLRDSPGAVRDCSQALEYDPANVKALVRRGLAFEELGKLNASLEDMDKAMKLPLSANFVKVVGQARSRLMTNMRNDRTLLDKCKDQNTLVNKDQTLRLHLHNSPPKVVDSGVSFRVDCNVANEFGLWRPRDFNSMCPETKLFPLKVKLRSHLVTRMPILRVEQLRSESSSASSASFSSISLTSSSNGNNGQGLNSNAVKQSIEEFEKFKYDTEQLYSQESIIWMDESAQASMTVTLELSECSSSQSVFIEILPLFSSEEARPVMTVLSLPIVINSNAATSNLISQTSFDKWSKIGAHCCRVSSVRLTNNSAPSASSLLKSESLDVVVAESPGHLGIGGKVWDAALVLLHYLSKERQLIEGKSVVELGAGTGLVGIACHKFGAKKMFITDLPDVCELIDVNIELNGVKSLSPISSDGTDKDSLIEAVPIGWSDPAPSLPPQLLHSGSNDTDGGSGGVINEKDETNCDGCIDIDTIVLSDVVYDPELYLPLVSTLSSLAPFVSTIQDPHSLLDKKPSSRKAVEIVLAHRHRNPMDHQFWAALTCAGFSVEKVDLKAMGLADIVMGGGAAADVNVFRVLRASVGGTREDIAVAVANAVPVPKKESLVTQSS